LVLLHVYPLNSRIVVIEIVYFFLFAFKFLAIFSFLNFTFCSCLLGVNFLLSDKTCFLQY